MAAVSVVYSIERVGEILGEDPAWLDEIAMEFDPEDGRTLVLGTGDSAVTALTEEGIENLRIAVEIYRANPHLGPKRPVAR